jgi:hypothetical protein
VGALAGITVIIIAFFGIRGKNAFCTWRSLCQRLGRLKRNHCSQEGTWLSNMVSLEKKSPPGARPYSAANNLRASNDDVLFGLQIDVGLRRRPCQRR